MRRNHGSTDPAVTGAALRESIRRAGASYETVAHRLGLRSRSSVAQWCSGAISVPLAYRAELRKILRAPHLFPEIAEPDSDDRDHPLLLALLESLATLPALPLELVEHASWEVWNRCAHEPDWQAAGKFTETLREAMVRWRASSGTTTRRLERVEWAARHGQLRSALYTCDWEQVERLSEALRQDIYRSPWLDVLDHSEQALILNSVALADFFLKSRFRRSWGPGSTAGRVSALRQALTVGLNHISEARRRLRIPQAAGRPAAAALRLQTASLLLDATEASMTYEAREEPSSAVILVLLADQVQTLAKCTVSDGQETAQTGQQRFAPTPGASPAPQERRESENEQPAEKDAIRADFCRYLLEEIFPRIELECRYNAAVIGDIQISISPDDRSILERNRQELTHLARRLPDTRLWRSELRITELLPILGTILGARGAIPRDLSLQMRHALGDLRDDFDRNALMGLARSSASLEVLLDVNLSRLPDCSEAEKEERVHSAAEVVDWMESSLQSYPDVPTGLVVQWNRAVLALSSGMREASTARELSEILQRFRDYGGGRIPHAAERTLALIAAGALGQSAASAVPLGARETLPSVTDEKFAVSDMVPILAPLLYPMMPISFIRPQGYEEPGGSYWTEELRLEE